MSDFDIPADLSAERQVIGAMLLQRDAVEGVVTIVTADDFYDPAHRRIFAALVDTFNAGQKIDPVVVATLLDERNELEDIGGPGKLIEIQVACAATSNANRHARTVLARSNARRLIGECEAAIDRAIDLDDPEEVREGLELGLGAITTPQAETDSLVSIDEFMRNYETEDRADAWSVDGLLKEGWRCVIVAGEGGGKTTLFRQFALAAAQGVHPFTQRPLSVGQVPTLIVDCENPEDSIYEVCRPITNRLERWFNESRGLGEYVDNSAWLYHKPGGINIRNRVDFAKLDAVIATVRPKLVCAGPLYKMYDEDSGDNVHTGMRGTLAALDKLRARYGFALMLEHHAPHGHSGSREMRPEGSSLLMRWPELGLGMTPYKERGQESKTHTQLTRWRADRTRNEWPNWLERAPDLSDARFPWLKGENPKRNNDYEGGYEDDYR